MNKKFNNKIKVLTLAGVIGVMSISAIAAPILKEVKASFKSDIEYRLNDAKVMEGTGALVYDNTVYLPIRAVAETLDLEVDYKDGILTMNTPSVNENSKITGPGETAPAQEKETLTIEEATIKEINNETSQVTVLPKGKEDKVENYIVLNVAQDTSIAHFKNKRIYTLADLKKDMVIKAEHSLIMTRSIPAQTPAIAITILDEMAAEETIKPAENVTLENKNIVEVNEKENYIVLGDIKNPENRDAHTIIHISEDTVIRHITNKKVYTLKDLEKGQTLNVVVSPAMTLSLPPQTTAIEIILVD